MSAVFSHVKPPFAVLETFIVTIMGCFSLITIIGNFMVLLSFYLDKNIRQPSNYYIFSLALSDFIIGIEGFPVRCLSMRCLHNTFTFRCSHTSL